MFLAVERATGRRVAAKAIHTDWLDRRRLEFLEAEIEIHHEVSVHPFIVSLLGVYNDPEACFIVEELAQGGSLLAHLHTRSTMGTEAEVGKAALLEGYDIDRPKLRGRFIYSGTLVRSVIFQH